MIIDAHRSKESPSADGAGTDNRVVAEGPPLRPPLGLRVIPNAGHKPYRYDDLQLGFNPLLFSSLEGHLSPSMLAESRDVKAQHMTEIFLRYSSDSELSRAKKHKYYREKIMPNYQPLHMQLYTMNAADFFAPSFLNAIIENTEESFRRIISEPYPGIYTFLILKPDFCELMASEVENFERWVRETKIRIMRPNTMNKCGAVLDDFGLKAMLDKLINDFVCPLSKVFFPEVSGSLDSHHGFVVEYGEDRDVDLGFHVDDSEVTINVCLGKQFTGGELFFQGIRCDKHIHTQAQSEENFDYYHVPGHAVLHHGRHRHGARATTSGHRVNVLLWCRSSVYRELKKYQADFTSCCGQCHREKEQRQQLFLSATKMELLIRDGKSAT